MIKTWNIGSLLLGRPPGWCYVSSREGLSGKTPLKLDFLPAQAGFPWNKSTSNHFFFKKKTRLVKPIIPTGHPTIRAKFHKITLEGRSSITFLPPCLGPSVTPVCFPGSEVFRPKKKHKKSYLSCPSEKNLPSKSRKNLATSPKANLRAISPVVLMVKSLECFSWVITPSKWMKINGFHWGDMSPINGVMGPYLKQVKAQFVEGLFSFPGCADFGEEKVIGRCNESFQVRSC